MKKFVYLVVLGLLAFNTSCSNSDFEEVTTSANNSKEEVKQSSSSINPVAAEYYKLISQAVLATREASSRAGESVDNPLIDRLETMDIDKCPTKRSFNEMDQHEQERFLQAWAAIEAEELSKKMAMAPELTEYVQSQNQIVSQVFKEEATSRSGELVVNDPSSFFAKIKERIEASSKMEADVDVNSSTQSTRATLANQEHISLDALKQDVAGKARRGDFIVSLPKHNAPYVLVNIGETEFKVGHSAIINNGNVNAETAGDALFTIGAGRKNGVANETLAYWTVRSYVMGIQKVKWIWTGIRTGWKKEVQPITDTEALANEAAKYMGKEYVRWYEFLFAKAAAPNRFTCTTLIWHSAKQAYGIDLSSWWATLVTPSGLYMNDNTYLRAEVND